MTKSACVKDMSQILPSNRRF